MKTVDETVPRLTSDGLALILGGRTYGAECLDANDDGRLPRMRIPPEIASFAELLLGKSRLLGLAENSAAAVIYDACDQDLRLLRSYRDACHALVERAVKARAAPDHKEAQTILERVIAELTPLTYQPSLTLGADALRLGPAALLRRLQSQFRTDVQDLAFKVAAWFHVLAENEHVCVLERFNATTLRYHFLRMDEIREELSRNVQRSGNLIEGVTTTTTTKTRVRVFNERRTHTLVGARTHLLGNYPARVPKRVALLIDSVPAELQPFIRIIDGHVTHEEVERRLSANKIEVETQSVYRPDPALVIFDTWVVTGWGGSTPEPSRSIYRRHPLARAKAILVASAAASLALAGLIEPIGGLRASAAVAVAGLLVSALGQLGLRLELRGRQTRAG